MTAQPETMALLIAGGLLVAIFALAGLHQTRRLHHHLWWLIGEIIKQDPNTPCPQRSDGKHWDRHSCEYGCFNYCFLCDKVWLGRELREAFYRRDASYFSMELVAVLANGKHIEFLLHGLRTNRKQPPDSFRPIVDEVIKLLSGAAGSLMRLPGHP